MKSLGLLGYPLGHTLSPRLHQLLAAEISGENSLEISYDLFEIAPGEFEQKKQTLFSLDGFNVTIPYKVRILDELDEIDQTAKNHGAVNTVAVRADGRRIGYNTDCVGFVRTMQQNGVELAGRVCVLGAGGVGRMFATECALRGCEVVIAVRKKSLAAASQVAEHIRTLCPNAAVQVQDIADISGAFDLVINATPCGMFPKVDESPVPKEFLQNVKTVFDCIYNPKETLLMRDAREMGCKTVGGLEMLVWQAAAAQQIWFGVQFTEEQIDRVTAALQN